MPRIAILALSMLALTACDRATLDERERAAGQILPGSASDAMLQTDGLQAEAPLADPTAAAKAGEAKPGRGPNRATDTSEPGVAASPSPTPEAPPTPQATAPPEV